MVLNVAENDKISDYNMMTIFNHPVSILRRLNETLEDIHSTLQQLETK